VTTVVRPWFRRGVWLDVAHLRAEPLGLGFRARMHGDDDDVTTVVRPWFGRGAWPDVAHLRAEPLGLGFQARMHGDDDGVTTVVRPWFGRGTSNLAHQCDAPAFRSG